LIGDEYLLIKELGIDGEEAEFLGDEIRLNSSRGTCYTIIVDNTVLAIAGTVIARPGLGELWSAATNKVKQNQKFYFKASKWGIKDGFERLRLRRLQTICRRDDIISYGWQIRLGFELEGIM